MATLNLMASPGPGMPVPSISNPAGLDLNQTNCEMVQCGAISEQQANLATATPPGPGMPPMPFASACAAAGWGGPAGGRFCSDSVCQPWTQQIMNAGPSGQAIECCVEEGGTYGSGGNCTLPTPGPMPSAVKSSMPSVTATAQLAAGSPQPVLTPQSLAAKMPTIVNPAPMVVQAPCSDPFSSWVNDNTLLAVGLLAVLGFAVFGKSK